MKTAMQQAIELTEEHNQPMPNWWWKQKLTELLLIEREQIETAFGDGYNTDIFNEKKYYDNTYNL